MTAPVAVVLQSQREIKVGVVSGQLGRQEGICVLICAALRVFCAASF
jgi:hypothetical protein